ncbi:MAG: diguanylate cyclase [Gammaproteobacteria bacterium]|nr:diguanylate cyclase [Gammaproteobacteria bacterium]
MSSITKEGRTTNIKRLLILLSSIFLVISLVVVTTLTIMTREKAVNELATKEAHKSAELVVQGLYSVMRKGWNKSEINNIIRRFNEVDTDMEVRIFRSDLVSEQFGEVAGRRAIRESDPLLEEAFLRAEEIMEEVAGSIRFLFPVKASKDCLVCHLKSQVGALHGVIDISFQTSRLKLPLDYILRSVVSYFAIAFCLLFIVLFYMLRAGIIHPVTHMVSVISHIMTENDLSVRTQYVGRVTEFSRLSGYFNEMLERLQTTQQHLEDLSMTDHLTGLLNRRKFEHNLTHEIGRAARYQREFSLVMMDLDDFKRVNDTYGHAVGDEVLIRFGEILRDRTRASDMVARLGGDEFSILLPETRLDVALEACNKIKQHLTESPMELSGESYTISGSFGVVCYPRDGEDAQQLMVAMDVAMYQAKDAGKGQV